LLLFFKPLSGANFFPSFYTLHEQLESPAINQIWFRFFHVSFHLQHVHNFLAREIRAKSTILQTFLRTAIIYRAVMHDEYPIFQIQASLTYFAYVWTNTTINPTDSCQFVLFRFCHLFSSARVIRNN